MVDYPIGYRKPPKHSQFKPGRSGNPAGRKAGSRGLKTDLAAELDAKQTIAIEMKPVTGTRQQLMVRTLAIRAAHGDLKAQRLLMATIIQVMGIEDRGGPKDKLSPADQALLSQLLADRSDNDQPDGSAGDTPAQDSNLAEEEG